MSVTGDKAQRIGLVPRLAVTLVLAVVACTACSGSGPGPGPGPGPASASGPATAPSKPPAPAYYLALGDSLSRGVQPNAAGADVETAQGYPDLVYAWLSRTSPALRLVQLGCPGETNQTKIHRGSCRQPRRMPP